MKKEAELIYDAVSNGMSIEDQEVIIIDIGGGSTEVTYCSPGEKPCFQSYNIGTVRLLNLYSNGQIKEYKSLKNSTCQQINQFLKEKVKHFDQVLVIGTGGNLRRLGKLRKRIFHKKDADFVLKDEISTIHKILKSYHPLKRAEKFKLKADRSEVIVHAINIFREILNEFPVKFVHVPNLGLVDGILEELKA